MVPDRKLGGYRCIFVSLGLVLGLSVAAAQEPPRAAPERKPVAQPRQEERGPASPQNATPEERNASPLVSSIQEVESAIRELVPKIDEEERQRQEERDIRDLDAQEEMALWAKHMTRATWASVMLTAIGVFLVWRTLKSTQEAGSYAKSAADAAWLTVKEAERSTIAAVKTSEITEKIGVNQLRPWIISTGVQFMGANNVVIDDEPKGPGTAFYIVWTNVGHHPAIKANMFIDFAVVPRGGKLPVFPSTRTDGTTALGHNVTFHGETRAIAGGDLNDFMTGKKEVICFSRIDYQGPMGFGEPYYSEATYRCSVRGHRENDKGQPEPVLSTMAEGPQNTVV